MAEKLDQDEPVSFRALLASNAVQVDAVTRLLTEKGIFTKEEAFEMPKRVQMEYKSNDDIRLLIRMFLICTYGVRLMRLRM